VCAATSAGLTIAANAAIATGPALLEALRSFLWNLFLTVCSGGWILGLRWPIQTLRRGTIFYTRHTETLFAENKLNMLICLWICFFVKANSTLYIVGSNLILIVFCPHIKVVKRPLLAHLHTIFTFFDKHMTCFTACEMWL